MENRNEKLDVIKIRREFHKYPELSWTEYRTTARIAEILTEMGYAGLKMGAKAICRSAIIEQVRLSDEQKSAEMDRALSQGAKKKFLDIPPNAMVRLEYRGSTPAIEEYGHRRVMAAIEGAARIHECEYKIVEYGDFPTAASDRECIEIVKAAAKKVGWFKNIYEEANVGGSDDATVYMRAVQKRGGKAVYFGLGTDTEFTLHNNKFDFDESVLPASVELCKEILMAVNGC